jgi:hypothetical protein
VAAVIAIAKKFPKNGKKNVYTQKIVVFFALSFESLLKEHLNMLFALNILFAPTYFLPHLIFFMSKTGVNPFLVIC